MPAADPHVMNTYGRLPIALSHGRGCRVWDTEGRKYLDALGGIAVNTLGHAHPKLVPALQEQIAKLIHSSNYYQVPLQEQLAAKLCELSGLTNVFFCSTGLEANEARAEDRAQVRPRQGIERPEIVVYEKAFHGRSIATLSATGNPKVQKGFGPLVEGFIRVPLNDIGAVREVARDATPTWWRCSWRPSRAKAASTRRAGTTCRSVRTLCDEQGLAADARRGAVRHGPHRQVVRPPVGRHRARRDAAGQGPGLGRADRRDRRAARRRPDVFGPGNHGTTFGGNPLAMRAGVETHAHHGRGRPAGERRHGRRAAARRAWSASLAGVAGVVEIRGQGLMLGIELDRPCGDLLSSAAEAGLLISVTADTRDPPGAAADHDRRRRRRGGRASWRRWCAQFLAGKRMKPGDR